MTWVQRLAEVEKESVECQRNTAEEGAEEDLQTAAMLNETAKVSIPEVWCVVFARDACSSKASVQLPASPLIGEGSNPHEYKICKSTKCSGKWNRKNLNANKMRSSLLHSQEAVAAAETGGWFSWVSGPSSVPASDEQMEKAAAAKKKEEAAAEAKIKGEKTTEEEATVKNAADQEAHTVTVEKGASEKGASQAESEQAAAEKNAAQVKVVMLAFCMRSKITVLSLRKLKQCLVCNEYRKILAKKTEYCTLSTT